MARTLAFDPHAKLKEAMKLFWQKGYTRTSMADLVQTLGINRYSLYNTFGDKQQLYLKALELYRLTVIRKLVDPLVDEPAGLDAVLEYLARLRTGLLAHSGHWGCLIQLTVLEQGPEDPVLGARARAMLAELEALLVRAFACASQNGELAHHIVPQRAARRVLVATQGAIALYRGSADRQALAETLDDLMQQVRGWSVVAST